MKDLSRKDQTIEKPTDALMQHLLEFVDLLEDERYRESDLENAIINMIELDGQAMIDKQAWKKMVF